MRKVLNTDLLDLKLLNDTELEYHVCTSVFNEAKREIQSLARYLERLENVNLDDDQYALFQKALDVHKDACLRIQELIASNSTNSQEFTDIKNVIVHVKNICMSVYNSLIQTKEESETKQTVQPVGAKIEAESEPLDSDVSEVQGGEKRLSVQPAVDPKRVHTQLTTSLPQPSVGIMGLNSIAQSLPGKASLGKKLWGSVVAFLGLAVAALGLLFPPAFPLTIIVGGCITGKGFSIFEKGCQSGFSKDVTQFAEIANQCLPQ